MKKFLLIAVCIFGLTGTAMALPFVDIIDFSGSGTTGGGVTYLTITEAYSYSHILGSIPVGSTLNSASLSLTHRYNSDLNLLLWGEVWLARENSDSILIGQLSGSSGGWTTDTWTLGSSVLANIQETTPWSLQVRLNEQMLLSENSLQLDRSQLAGDYTAPTGGGAGAPVPEPASMMMLGMGILGLVGLKRKA